METQKQIKRTLSDPDAIATIARLLKESGDIARTKLADEVCRHFGFFDPRGKTQCSGCLKALRELERQGHFVLPPGRILTRGRGPRSGGEPVPAAEGVPSEAGQVLGLQLILVETFAQRQVWNDMMTREHPRGAGPLVGRQLRYLVGSEHGLLGGLGFSAAALQLRDRDRWIGWDVETRRAHLHYVVCLSRFLVRETVRCRNLASRVLGMGMRALPEDFAARFGYRPLLVESFVDGNRFLGTCYRAANWACVGRTQGRGRQDRFRQFSESVKDIYLYPLDKEFRRKMGIAADIGLTALDCTDGIEAEEWAEKEFGGALLGDTRLSRRLVEVAFDTADKPGRAFTGVAKGDWPKVKGYYRMIDAPEDSALTMANILCPHRERTAGRMKGQQSKPGQSILEQLERRQAREGGQPGQRAASGIVITVYGAKGGIGKTTVAANLATALAQAGGGSVALADMDTQFGDVAIMMDIPVEKTIVDLARRADEIDRELVGDYLVQHSSNVRILPAPFEPSQWRAVTPDQMGKIIAVLAQTHDFVVLDTASTFNDVVAVALDKANVVLLVTSMDISSIKNTLVVLKLLASSSFPQDKVKLTINHANATNTVKEEDVKNILRQEIFWRIPYDESVGASVQLGKPVVVAKPGARVSQSILDLAAVLSGKEKAPEPKRRGLFGRLLGR